MLYYIYGDNTRFIKYEKLIKKLKKENHTDEIISFPGTIEDINEFLNKLNSNSLFDNHKIFVIKKFEDIDYKKVYSYLKSYNLNNLLDNKSLIIMQEIDNKKTKDKEFANKMIKLDGNNIEASNYISEMVKYIEKKININSNDAKKLATLYENDFFRLKNEIDKLELIYEDEEINFDKIKYHLLVEEDDNYFEKIDNILNGNTNDVNEDNFLAIINALNKDLMNIYLIHIFDILGNYNTFMSKYDENLKTIFSNAHPYVIYKKIEYKNLFNKKQIIELLDKLNDIEVKFKTGIYDKNISVTLIKNLFNKEEVAI